MVTRVSEAEFVDVWHRLGSPSAVAQETGLAERAVLARRKRLAGRGIRLETRAEPSGMNRGGNEWKAEDGWAFPRVKSLNITNGAVIVSSDHHYWPVKASTAHRALIEVAKRVKPVLKILNGDVFDGCGISRHDPHGWARRPSLKEEIEICRERIDEIETAIGPDCQKLWNIGNHDIRFERYLISRAAEMEGMFGARLKDHFPKWPMGWSILINDRAMIKHRFAGGVHAGYNNTMKGGLTVVTGHTHILEVKPWVDWTGRRWGVQTGTVADVDGPQFEYQENNPSPACSGFAVLTYRDGGLLPPELCEVIDGKAYFRGEIVA